MNQPKVSVPKSVVGYAALQSLFATVAFFLMLIGCLHCHFIQFTDTSGTSSKPISLQFGIWHYQDWHIYPDSGKFYFESSCDKYPDDFDIDSSWKSARAFSIMAFIFALILIITGIITACSSPKQLTRGWMVPIYMLTCLCQGLCLLLLNSSLCKDNTLIKVINLYELKGITFPDTCSIGTGAKYVISATVFWFVAGLSSFAAYRAEKAEAAADEDAGLSEPLVGP